MCAEYLLHNHDFIHVCVCCAAGHHGNLSPSDFLKDPEFRDPSYEIYLDARAWLAKYGTTDTPTKLLLQDEQASGKSACMAVQHHATCHALALASAAHGMCVLQCMRPSQQGDSLLK